MNGERKRKKAFAATGATEEVKTDFSLVRAGKAGEALLRKQKIGQAQCFGLDPSVKAARLLVLNL